MVSREEFTTTHKCNLKKCENIGLTIGAVDVLVHWYIVKYCSAKDVGGRVTNRANLKWEGSSKTCTVVLW